MDGEIKMDAQQFELTDDELNDVVGGFTEGVALTFKCGRTKCVECGMTNITTMTYCGTDATRLALVMLPCGHQTYIPERALMEL